MNRVLVLLVALSLAVPASLADTPPAAEGKPAAARPGGQKADKAAVHAPPAAGKPAAGEPARKPSTMDRMQLRSTTITGNQELPKVMYVVPWKRADSGGLGGKPFNSLVDEALQPVDRDVFGREIRYFRAVEHGGKGDAETPVTATKDAP